MTAQTLEQTTHTSKSSGRGVLTTTLLVVLVLLMAGILYVLALNRTLNKAGASSNEVADAARITAAVQQLIETPAGETPTVARINDVAELQSTNPTFYKDARFGDYLVVFTSEALLYRPDDKRIVKVSPVFVNTGSGALDTGSN